MKSPTPSAVPPPTPGHPPPLIVHVIHHLVIGGMENGLVNLINRLPADRYRHAIVCMDDFSDFRNRIVRDDVEVVAVRKRERGTLANYFRLYALFRRMRPAIVHSRNLSGLDSLLPAFLAGVRRRIHGEHGRDVDDLDGENNALVRLRRLHSPLVSRYVCVSRDLERYLIDRVGIDARRVQQVYNGVDVERFRPLGPEADRSIPGAPWPGGRRLLVGTVGRLQPVKNQKMLVDAFAALVDGQPGLRPKLGLVLIGDGPERGALQAAVTAAGIDDCVWFAGPRADVADLLPRLDLFVLPSLAEGISNTVLEAMACGLPVVASAVGGNRELVVDGVTGRLVPSGDFKRLAEALQAFAGRPDLINAAGRAARRRALDSFSLTTMVGAYDAIYQAALGARPQEADAVAPSPATGVEAGLSEAKTLR